VGVIVLYFDFSAVQRLDNAMSIQFLTSAASILHKHGHITPKETDNLRLTLSRINTNTPTTNSVFLELEQNQSEILSILKYRFGTSGLALNLIRISMQQSLRPLQDRLTACGHNLVKKSQIVFNRPLFIYSSGKPQYKTLASTFVIDLAEKIVATTTHLSETINRFGWMIPSQEPSSEDVGIDLEIAEALGLSGLTDKVLPFNEEKELVRRVHQALLSLADYCSDFSEQVIQNQKTEAGHNLLSSSEILRAECLRLSAINFPEGDSFTMWETRRRHLSANISSITEALKLVCTACEEAVNFEPSTVASMSDRDSVKNRLVTQMVGSGTPVALAAKAAQDFIVYLRDKQLSPGEVIAGELSRINPLLNVRCLELLQNDVSEVGSMAASSDLKKRVVDRSKALADQLKNLAVTIGLVSLLPFFIGCGLKTNPKSTATELRPDVLFKSAAQRVPDYIITSEKNVNKGTNQPDPKRGTNGNKGK
jgi:hypothetical protein